MKQVKKEVKNNNFYLMVVEQIKEGKSPSDIAKILSISKQKLNYYIQNLKKQGNINKIGYGTWEVKKEVKTFSLGLRPTTNLHALQIYIPILEGTIIDKDWVVKNKLNHWLPKYKHLDNLEGLTIRNNNNKSISVFVKSRNIESLEEIDNLSFKVKAYINEYFKNQGIILDIMACKVTNLNIATEDKEADGMIRKGEKFELDLNKKAEKVFPQDDIDAKAWIDGSPFKFSAETNDKDWKREYLAMPIRIREQFGVMENMLKLMELQTRSTTALSENIKSHIPSWMSNIKVEQELKKFNRMLKEKQKYLGEYI